MRRHFLIGLSAAASATAFLLSSFDRSDPVGRLVDRLKGEEGFKSKPYRDTRGILTIGYGTAIGLGITPQEAEILLRYRLVEKEKELASAWPPYGEQPGPIQSALLDMSYQLGVHGVLEFQDMLAALAGKDYETAARAVEQSAWNRETPKRVERVAAVFRSRLEH